MMRRLIELVRYACKLSGRFDSWLILRLIFGGKSSDSGYKEHNEKTQGYFHTKPCISVAGKFTGRILEKCKNYYPRCHAACDELAF